MSDGQLMRIRIYLKSGGSFEVDASRFHIQVHGATNKLLGYEWQIDKQVYLDSEDSLRMSHRTLKELVYCDVSEIAAITALAEDGKPLDIDIATMMPAYQIPTREDGADYGEPRPDPATE